MVVYETIYFEVYTNDQYMWHTNNIAQLYFILGTAELHQNFSVNLSIPLIYTDFPTVGLNHVCYWISVNIRGIPKSTRKIPM